MKIKFLYVLTLYFMWIQKVDAQKINPIAAILQENSALFGEVLKHPQQNELQIICTQIDRDINQKAHFSTFTYRLNDHHYFYPASTVKLPTAVFALEKLNELQIAGLNKETPLNIGVDFEKQKACVLDTSAENKLPSIANYIKKILLVSDNDAFNRIYEFTDRATINQKLKHYGFDHSRIVNRLAVGDKGETAKHTNPISFLDKNGKAFYTKSSAYDPKDYPLKLHNLIRGKGYLNTNDSLINAPFDFTGMNVFQLSDQHELIKRLFFPSNYPTKKRFNLKADDYDFLYRYMSKYPTESEHPNYSSPEYHASYCKFLFYGADRKKAISPNIRIFNKVGDSYGYTIDNMYFIDYENKVEFILSAVIQSNQNEIYNDNHYEYETVCLPFMRNLGEKVYELELQRPKKNLPTFKEMLSYQ